MKGVEVMFRLRSLPRKSLRTTSVLPALALAFLLASTWLLSACTALAASEKGRFAFRYTASLTDEELAWLQRFDIVVPGDILPDDQVQALHAAGSKIFFYSWATGDYISDPGKLDPGSWEALIYKKRKSWLLNPDKADEGPDGTWRAYYYDPYPSDFKRARVGWLEDTREQSKYDGVFFDLVGSIYIPEYLREVYQSRHPQKPYDQALAEIFSKLRKEGSLVFTNQGYRTPQYYLPVADYDLTESLITSYVWGEKVRIFVEGEGLVEREETFYEPWVDLRRLVGDIQAQVDRYNPSVRILHLSYTNPFYQPTGDTVSIEGAFYPVFREEIDRAAIFYGYAAGKLWGHDSYSSGPSLSFTKDEIYFTHLGDPQGNDFEERDRVVIRYYENGVVVLNPSTETQTVDLGSPLIPGGVRGFQDLYNGTEVAGLWVTIPSTPSPASGRVYPSGRVYLYLR